MKNKHKRPTGITVLAILIFIDVFISLFLGIPGIMYLSGKSGMLNSLMRALYYMGIIRSFIGAFVGWGLWNLKNWARIVAIIYSVFLILTFIGAPVGIVLLVILSKENTRKAFQEDEQTVEEEEPLQILKKKLALGVISEKEFERKKKLLKET